ncbi:MAG: hypothetical protein V2I82_11525 [Halieaceae bacterium]|jgi:hypothetical protein|nr:hypothetical protein [Halieaceae bacterium]
MAGFNRSPRLLKAGLVLMNRDTEAIERSIVLQYNPDSLSRSLSARGAGDDGDPLEANRLSGPPVETISLEAVFDATDGLAEGDDSAAEFGIGADLAALESVLYPSSQQLRDQDALASRGSIEILPATTPLVLFVWGRRRILPVRITDLSITEEAFDTQLNPIRARISLSLRVLTVNDLAFGSVGGALSLLHHQLKERLTERSTGRGLAALGIDEVIG